MVVGSCLFWLLLLLDVEEREKERESLIRMKGEIKKIFFLKIKYKIIVTVYIYMVIVTKI